MKIMFLSEFRIPRPSLVLSALALVLAGGLSAAPLDLARVPLVINASVPPNIVVTLDDSGSMGFGYMPDTANYGSTDCRFYDSATNALYFNPDLEYPPPLRADGTSFPNASQTAAWRDGFSQGLGTENLQTAYRASNNHNNVQDYSSGWYTSFPSGVTNAQGQRRAFYCRNNSVRLIQNESQNWQKFANWFSYYRTRSLAARTALSTAFARIDPSVRVARQNLNTNAIVAGTQINSLSNASWRTNFFSWLHAPRFSGGTPLRESLARAGRFYERSSGTTTNPYWDERYEEELSCRQNFHLLMTDGYWTGQSGGNITAATATIGNSDTAGAAIVGSRTLSGPAAQVYWNAVSGGDPSDNPPNLADIAFHYWSRDLRDLDNDVPPYFADRSTGLVAGASVDDEIYFNPANDPATWQHMVNFIVGFGVGGTLPNTDAQLLRLRQGQDMWPRIRGGSGGSCSLGDAVCRTTIDDAWHAAINSRGEYLSAQNPQQLVDAISSILDNVSQRQGVTGTAGSSAFQRSDSLMFEASYDSGNWTGDINAFALNPDGTQGAPAWTAGSAADQLDARSPAGRMILINRNSSGAANAVNFLWGNLTAAQQDALNRNPVTGVVDGQGQNRVDYIRGVRDEEQSVGGIFRNRASVLGAFLATGLAYVQAPANTYAGRAGFSEGGELYAQFRNSHRERAPMLYIGGNDGMLHAFDALTGEERWAFIPNKISRNLARLTTPQYQFVPFVNNSPVTSDVYIGGQWRTVLVGTLGLGGQGAYAIDITSPTAPNVLWEFTDENDPRLGYTYGQAAITRLDDGRWVALIPGGYNNEARVDYATRGLPPTPQPEEPAAQIGDGIASLFVVDIQNGTLIDEFSLPSSAVGLASPTVGDYEFDFAADMAVAGDLNGNLWRFGLKQEGDDADFGTVIQIFRGSSDRPITSAPRIFSDPVSGELIMVFGTGKYLEIQDREIEDNDPRQAIYGIRECRARDDCAAYPISDGNLVEQTLTSASGDFIDMDTTHYLDADAAGWFMRLGNPAFFGGALIGERIIDRPLAIFSTGIIVMGSFIPSAEPCSPEGSGVLYILSAFTGGFALPDGLNEDGTEVVAGDPVFEGASAYGVGGYHRDGKPPMQFFGCQGGGCVVADGQRFYFTTINRRSGWREIPTD